jgi:hypothetical protein
MLNKIFSFFKKGGALIVPNKKFASDSDDATGLDKQIRDKCNVDGEALLENFLKTRSREIAEINNLFDAEGRPKEANRNLLSATTYNDLYKWTMMPVIRALESTKGQITVTFGIDLRDAGMRQALRDSNPTGPASGLILEIHNALKSLETRHFNRDIFNMVLSGPRKSILAETDLNAICGPVDNPRTLVEVGGVKDYGVVPDPQAMSSESVSIYFYYRQDKNYDSEVGVHFIEAVGPWHKVTWLETTMMQAVYEAKLRYDLRLKGVTYGEWLYSALLRCAKSICYTKEVCKSDGKTILPALFAGRRTGGLQFTLLQHLLFADNFIQFKPPQLGGPSPLENSQCAASELACLGTSSCDALFIMTKRLNLPCHSVVGTHAHELSMVNSVLFSEADTDNVPYSQVISHYLYYLLTWKKTGGMMPMLPDTLGTRAFLLAASRLVMPDQSNFLYHITSARQDSGQLDAFIQNMKDFGYLNPDGSSVVRDQIAPPNRTTLMASEIDTTATLLEATQLGYQYFGAGGFYGDSVKVWDDKRVSSNSMAVKAVRVSFVPTPEELSSLTENQTPIIHIHDGIVTGYPVKIGDTSPGSEGVIAQGKLSIDRNLESDHFESIKLFASRIRGNAGSPGSRHVDAVSSVSLNAMMRYYGLNSFIPTEGGSNNRKQSRRQKQKRKLSKRRY